MDDLYTAPENSVGGGNDIPAETSPETPVKRKKWPLLAGLAVLALVLAAAAFWFYTNAALTETEESAARDVIYLKSMMKNPDSFKLRGDALLIRFKNPDKGNPCYTYIDYSATNSFGASLRSIAVFLNHRYLFELDDRSDTDDMNTMLERYNATTYYALWRAGALLGETEKETEEWTSMLADGKKVAKEARCDYME